MNLHPPTVARASYKLSSSRASTAVSSIDGPRAAAVV